MDATRNMATDTLFQTARMFDDKPVSPGAAAIEIGNQMEALGKKLEALNPAMGNWLRQYGLMFRGGECDALVRRKLEGDFDGALRKHLLLLDVELVFHTVAAARATNLDFVTAYCMFLDQCWAPWSPKAAPLDFSNCIK